MKNENLSVHLVFKRILNTFMQEIKPLMSRVLLKQQVLFLIIRTNKNIHSL